MGFSESPYSVDVRSHSSIHRLEDCLRDILGLPFSATLSRSQSCIILRARQVDPYVISYVGRLSSSRRFDIASPWLASLLARFRFLPLALGAGGPRPPVNIPPPGFGSCSILSHAVPGAASLPRLRPRCPEPHWIVSLFAAIRVSGISHPICCRSLPSLSGARNPHKAKRPSSPGGDRAPPEVALPRATELPLSSPRSDRAPPGATELPRGPRSSPEGHGSDLPASTPPCHACRAQLKASDA